MQLPSARTDCQFDRNLSNLIKKCMKSKQIEIYDGYDKVRAVFSEPSFGQLSTWKTESERRTIKRTIVNPGS